MNWRLAQAVGDPAAKHLDPRLRPPKPSRQGRIIAVRRFTPNQASNFPAPRRIQQLSNSALLLLFLNERRPSPFVNEADLPPFGRQPLVGIVDSKMEPEFRP